MLPRRLIITSMLVVFLCSSLIPFGIALGGAKVLELWIGKTQINLDGVLMEIDVVAFIADNRTMVPLRVVTASFGARVKWFSVEQKVMIFFIGKTIVLWVGEMSALVNGQQKYFDAPPLIVGDRTFVSIRFISQNIGGTVGWNQVERKVTIPLEENWKGLSLGTSLLISPQRL
ncbi:MAG: copper amine oxidase N-terminal domain-containing protein [Deltaproteobacteria bacterium]